MITSYSILVGVGVGDGEGGGGGKNQIFFHFWHLHLLVSPSALGASFFGHLIAERVGIMSWTCLLYVTCAYDCTLPWREREKGKGGVGGGGVGAKKGKREKGKKMEKKNWGNRNLRNVGTDDGEGGG